MTVSCLKRLVLFAPFLLPGLVMAQAQSYLRDNSFTHWESPHVHPLDLTPDGTRLLAVNTANNALEVFDVSNANALPVFLKSVPVGLDPVSVRARNNTEAWVVNVISDSVSIVNLATGSVTQTLQTDDEPADVVFGGANFNDAFVSCAQAKTLLEFSATSPSTPINRIPVNGEQPRALATSADGRYVYLAIFESGNGTTLLVGGQPSTSEHDNISDPSGPYGGVNPPPNSGTNFNPPIAAGLPKPPPVSLILKRTPSGGVVKWLDDNLHDWSAFITGAKAKQGTEGDRVAGWDLPDRDVAIIDTSNNNAVSYQSGLMNINMSLAVNPASGAVTVVGTDATNQIRFEPVVKSTFVHVEGATFTPGGTNSIFDLNPQINYALKTLPVASRQQAIGDPRGIVWNASGTVAYVTGMGSNNVAVISNSGARQGLIAVGQGPTGIVLQQGTGRAFILNKFDATISTVNLASAAEAGRTPLFYDPTPASVKAGRPLLYNTQTTSGLGQAACASCHVDARWDRLAWDLGNPAGSMVTNSQGISFHPMKGPLLTQTLVDTMQAPYLHWRGDRPALEHFATAFQTLMGADAAATPAQIKTLRDFLSTVSLPPNPYRNLDNSFSTNVAMPGPNNTVFTSGDANKGAAEFEANCRSCHVGHTARGALFDTAATDFGAGVRNPPTWKNFYKRIGLWFGEATASNSGFAFQQDGSFDSSQDHTRTPEMYAFMMSVNGGFPYEPAGLDASNWSNNAHAAVGKQVTLSPSNPNDTTGLLTQLETLAANGAIGLVAKGGVPGARTRGWVLINNGNWQSDQRAEIDTTAALMNLVTQGSVLTFTAVPVESAIRIGIDMDGDGLLDGDDPNPNVPDFTMTNLALNGTATAVSVHDSDHTADKAIDGNTIGYFDQRSMVHTLGGDYDWWQVDLGQLAQINLIQLFNRIDPCCTARLSNVSIFVSQTPFTSTNPTATRAQAGVKEYLLSGYAGLVPQVPMNIVGRYVRVQLNAKATPLHVAEVRVMGYPVTQSVVGGVQVFTPVLNPVPLKTVVRLDTLFNVDAIAMPGQAVRNGGVDGNSYAYDTQLLGTSLTYKNLVFPLGQYNVLSGLSGGTVPLPVGQFQSLYLLGTAVDGEKGNQTVMVTYTDGTTGSYTQSFSDWVVPSGNAGETVVATMPGRVNPSGAINNAVAHVYGYTFALAAGKSVQSVTLPNAGVVVLGVGLSQ